jgi:hypothetical protein
MNSARQAVRHEDLDTMVDFPAAAAHSPSSDVPPPLQSESRALAVPRPPRPAPRAQREPTKAAISSVPPPLPVAAKAAEPVAERENATMELDASCIEEVRALVSASPPARPAKAPKQAAASPLAALGPIAARALALAVTTSRRLLTLLCAVAFFVVYAASAALGWLRATLLPAMRAATVDARDRLVIEWSRASSRARDGGSS